MPWLRLDADCFDHPKMLGLPIGAQYLFLRICCTMKVSSERVSLSESYWSPEYWAKRVGATPSECDDWIKSLTDAGLIEHDGLRLMVHNWRKYQADPTASERKAEQREREKCVTDVTVTTVRHDDRTGQDRTIQDRTQKKEPAQAPSGFDAFWAAYPRKIGKKAAARAWRAALDLPPLEELLSAIEAQRGGDAWTRDGGAYIPNPATWINQGRWTDEVLPPRREEAPSERRERLEREASARLSAEIGARLAAKDRERGIG